METGAHLRLKHMGLQFLIHAGCQAVASEVGCPFSRYRIDVAGYLDTRPVHPADAADTAAATLWESTPEAIGRRRRARCEPRTVFVECKQARSDFLRDGRETRRLLQERERLELRARELEEQLIKPGEPHLRRSGGFLFPELEAWEFQASRSGAYRRILREMRRVERQLHGETKFWMASRYRLADRLYVLAPAGMIVPRELPRGWGLIECPPGVLARRKVIDERPLEELLRVAVRAPEQGCRPELRARLLRNIAVAATRAALGAQRWDRQAEGGRA